MGEHGQCWGDDDNQYHYQLLITGLENGQKLDTMLQDIMLKICKLGMTIAKMPEDECSSTKA